jgi:hypothetical protein
MRDPKFCSASNTFATKIFLASAKKQHRQSQGMRFTQVTAVQYWCFFQWETLRLEESVVSALWISSHRIGNTQVVVRHEWHGSVA